MDNNPKPQYIIELEKELLTLNPTPDEFKLILDFVSTLKSGCTPCPQQPPKE
jgi:hypothetical protein